MCLLSRCVAVELAANADLDGALVLVNQLHVVFFAKTFLGQIRLDVSPRHRPHVVGGESADQSVRQPARRRPSLQIGRIFVM